jgi:hypothetical protein
MPAAQSAAGRRLKAYALGMSQTQSKRRSPLGSLLVDAAGRCGLDRYQRRQARRPLSPDALRELDDRMLILLLAVSRAGKWGVHHLELDTRRSDLALLCERRLLAVHYHRSGGEHFFIAHSDVPRLLDGELVRRQQSQP